LQFVTGFAKAGIVFESDGKSVGVKLNIRRSAPLRGLHRKPACLTQVSALKQSITRENAKAMRKGPLPQGRLWTPADDAQLLMLFASNIDKVLIARKLKRTVSAVTKRKSVLKKAREVASDPYPEH